MEESESDSDDDDEGFASFSSNDDADDEEENIWEIHGSEWPSLKSSTDLLKFFVPSIMSRFF